MRLDNDVQEPAGDTPRVGHSRLRPVQRRDTQSQWRSRLVPVPLNNDLVIAVVREDDVLELEPNPIPN
jgi:hypothetical protein